MLFKYSNKILEKEIDDLKDQCYKINSNIRNDKWNIDYLNDEIDDQEEELKNMEEQIIKIKKEIREKKNKLSNLKNSLPAKNKEYIVLEKKLDEKKVVLNNEIHSEFKKYVLSIQDKQCYTVQLYPDTATIDLLDKFCSSRKDVLILKNQFWLPNNRVYASLIVTPYYSCINSERTQPTMTELKKNVEKNINTVSCYRLTPLKQELSKIDKNNELNNSSTYVFDTPFLIGGQTSNNRTGYGCEWIGSGDYIEGTLYGEVTNFMIAGFIVNSSYY